MQSKIIMVHYLFSVFHMLSIILSPSLVFIYLSWQHHEVNIKITPIFQMRSSEAEG